jgi:lambda family phage tail tape measure protein
MSAVLDILINTDADKATAELKALESQSKKTATATEGLERSNKAANDSYRGLGGGIRNASYQVTDFMVQVQGGTSVIRAMSQQLPQLLAGFGMVGVVIGMATTAIGFAIESLDLFPSSMDRVNKTAKATETALGNLKDMHFKLGDDTIKVLKSWQEQWNVSSEDVRKNLKMNLDMYVLTMQAELAALKSREDYDKAIAKGTGRETFTGLLLQGGETDLNKRAEAMGRLSKATTLQTQLDAVMKLQQNPNSAIPLSTSEIKSQESLIQTYDRKVAAIQAEAGALQISNVEKKLAIELANLEIDKNKIGANEYLRLKDAITQAVYARNTSEETKKIKEYSDAQQSANDILADEAKRLTMSTREFEKYIAQKRFAQEINKQTIGMSPEGKGEFEAVATELFKVQQATLDLNDANKRTFSGGATEAMRKYGEEASNIGSQVGNTFTNAFRGMEDALVQFTMTGKANFKSFALSIIADIQRILVRQALLAPIAGGISSFFAIPAGGGRVGGAAPVTDYSTPLASGTNYVPYDGFPATLHKGEAVVPAAYNPSAGGSGTGTGTVNNVTVQVNMNGQDKTSASTDNANKLGVLISSVVKTELIKQQRNGGLLSGA